MTAQKIVKELREKHGLSREEIAVKLRVSANAIQSWETGTRTPKYVTIEKLQQILRGYKSASKR